MSRSEISTRSGHVSPRYIAANARCHIQPGAAAAFVVWLLVRNENRWSAKWRVSHGLPCNYRGSLPAANVIRPDDDVQSRTSSAIG
jgi:hypothetical protein